MLLPDKRALKAANSGWRGACNDGGCPASVAGRIEGLPAQPTSTHRPTDKSSLQDNGMPPRASTGDDETELVNWGAKGNGDECETIHIPYHRAAPKPNINVAFETNRSVAEIHPSKRPRALASPRGTVPMPRQSGPDRLEPTHRLGYPPYELGAYGLDLSLANYNFPQYFFGGGPVKAINIRLFQIVASAALALGAVGAQAATITGVKLTTVETTLDLGSQVENNGQRQIYGGYVSHPGRSYGRLLNKCGWV